MIVRRLVPAVLVVTAAVFLALAEIQRLAGQTVSTLGTTFSLGGVSGPAALSSTAQWSGWTSASNPAGFIRGHTLLDLVLFIPLYAVLFGIAIWHILPAPTSAEFAAARTRRLRLLIILGALVVADVLEDVMLLVASSQVEDGTAVGGAVFQAVVSTAKWIAMAVLIVGILRAPVARASIATWLRNGRASVHAQRLSAIVVLVLGILSLVPGTEVLEQLPDVQRAWFDDLWLGAATGLLHGVFAALAVTGVAITFFVIGRKRAELYYRMLVLGEDSTGLQRTYSDPQKWRQWPGALYVGWFIIPVLVAVAAIIVGRIDSTLIDGTVLAWFLGIAFGVPIVSLLIDGIWYRFIAVPTITEPQTRPEQLPRAWRIARAGDLFALLVIVLALIGLTRSLVPYIVIGLTDGSRIGLAADWVWLFVLIAVIAVLGSAALLFFLPDLLVPPLVQPNSAPGAAPGPPPAPVADQGVLDVITELDWTVPSPAFTRPSKIAIAASLIFSIVVLVVAIRWPLDVIGAFGVVAVMVGALGAWTSLIGLAILALRQRQPLGLFAALGLRSDPVIALFLVVPIAISSLIISAPVHAIDRSHPADIDRSTLAAEFEDWLTRSQGCTTVLGTNRVRPLVLVAAEGGGIRAATWTASVMSSIEAAGPCAANAVFLSSGASGGSVGLAVSAKAGGDPAAMTSGVVALSDSTALASAVSGLLVSDPLASTTGVRVPNDGPLWRDRASLIEQSWRDAVPSLTDPFDAEPHAPTGLVAFNSVDLLTGCRVTVSQVILDGAGPPAITGDERVDCKLDTDEPPLTIDLLAAFPENCPWDADWATTAMNSARFPVVTPAGGIDRAADDDCKAVHVQLVDGGYAENTALGLQADIAPELSQLVRAYNASLGAGEHLVVPYLLYIQNSPDGYVDEPPRLNTPQLIVPIVGNGTKAEQLTPSTWIQRIMSAYAQVCETSIETDGPCAGLVDGSLVTKRRTVVAAVNTEVAVSVPLGWGLSETTATRLLDDARAQAAACPASARDYPCLATLLTGLMPEG